MRWRSEPGHAAAWGARIAAGGLAAAIVAGFAIGALGPASWGTAIAHGGLGCPFRGATGIDCPFCGMTRATIALGGGHWHDALALHPLAPVVLVGVLGLLAVVALGRGDALARGRRPWWLLGAIGLLWILRLVL